MQQPIGYHYICINSEEKKSSTAKCDALIVIANSTISAISDIWECFKICLRGLTPALVGVQMANERYILCECVAIYIARIRLLAADIFMRQYFVDSRQTFDSAVAEAHYALCIVAHEQC